jgi:hypothetical protein
LPPRLNFLYFCILHINQFYQILNFAYCERFLPRGQAFFCLKRHFPERPRKRRRRNRPFRTATVTPAATGIGFFEETTGAKRTFRATEKRPLQKSDQPKKMPLPGKLFINFRQLTQAALTVFNCI